MTNPYLGLTADDFRQGAGGAIPRGYAWNASPDTVQGQTWGGIAGAVQQLHARAGVLSEQESDPGRAVELLADWEHAYGLPDHCTPFNATIQQRQAALVARIASQGGQSIAYYVAVAAALGYSITITEFRPFRVSRSRVGDALLGEPWLHTWRVNAPSVTMQYFRVGRSAVGERLRTWGNGELQCRLGELAPAHTVLQFAYR
ncbi:MAG: putative phage tail protein [Acetobacteraceae bacterium]